MPFPRWAHRFFGQCPRVVYGRASIVRKPKSSLTVQHPVHRSNGDVRLSPVDLLGPSDRSRQQAQQQQQQQQNRRTKPGTAHRPPRQPPHSNRRFSLPQNVMDGSTGVGGNGNGGRRAAASFFLVGLMPPPPQRPHRQHSHRSHRRRPDAAAVSAAAAVAVARVPPDCLRGRPAQHLPHSRGRRFHTAAQHLATSQHCERRPATGPPPPSDEQHNFRTSRL